MVNEEVKVGQTWLHGGTVLLRILKVEGRRMQVKRIGTVDATGQEHTATDKYAFQPIWWNISQLMGRVLARDPAKFDAYLAKCK